MNEITHTCGVGTGALLAFAVGWSFLVAPNRRAEEAIRAEIAQIAAVPVSPSAERRLDELGRELLALRSRAIEEAALPREPALEQLIALSARADRKADAGRTVRAGKARALASGGAAQFAVLPVAVHLDTTLEPTLALVQAIDAHGPALRIDSIEVVAARTSGPLPQKALLVSTIEVEAIYEGPVPPAHGKGGHAK